MARLEGWLEGQIEGIGYWVFWYSVGLVDSVSVLKCLGVGLGSEAHTGRGWYLNLDLIVQGIQRVKFDGM